MEGVSTPCTRLLHEDRSAARTTSLTSTSEPALPEIRDARPSSGRGGLEILPTILAKRDDIASGADAKRDPSITTVRPVRPRPASWYGPWAPPTSRAQYRGAEGDDSDHDKAATKNTRLHHEDFVPGDAGTEAGDPNALPSEIVP